MGESFKTKPFNTCDFTDKEYPFKTPIQTHCVVDELYYYIPRRIFQVGAIGWRSFIPKNDSIPYYSALHFFGRMLALTKTCGSNQCDNNDYYYTIPGTQTKIRKALLLIHYMGKNGFRSEYIGHDIPSTILFTNDEWLGIMVSFHIFDAGISFLQLLQMVISENVDDAPPEVKRSIAIHTTETETNTLVEISDEDSTDEHMHHPSSSSTHQSRNNMTTIRTATNQSAISIPPASRNERLQIQNDLLLSAPSGPSSRGGRGRGGKRQNTTSERQPRKKTPRKKKVVKSAHQPSKQQAPTDDTPDIMSYHKNICQLYVAIGCIIDTQIIDSCVIKNDTYRDESQLIQALEPGGCLCLGVVLSLANTLRRIRETYNDSYNNIQLLEQHYIPQTVHHQPIDEIVIIDCDGQPEQSEQHQPDQQQQQQQYHNQLNEGSEPTHIFTVPFPEYVWSFSPLNAIPERLTYQTFPWKSTDTELSLFAAVAQSLHYPIDVVRNAITIDKKENLQTAHQMIGDIIKSSARDDAHNSVHTQQTQLQNNHILPPYKYGNNILCHYASSGGILKVSRIFVLGEIVRALYKCICNQLVNAKKEIIGDTTDHNNTFLWVKYNQEICKRFIKRDAHVHRHRHKHTDTTVIVNTVTAHDDLLTPPDTSSPSLMNIDGMNDDDDEDINPLYAARDTTVISIQRQAAERLQQKEQRAKKKEEANELYYQQLIRYSNAVKTLRHAAKEACLTLFSPDAYIPDSIKICERWMSAQDVQIINITPSYSNLGMFSQTIVAMMASVKACVVPTNSYPTIITFTAACSCLVALILGTMMVHVVLRGRPGTGKSVVGGLVAKMCVPGVVPCAEGGTAMASLLPLDQNDNIPGDQTYIFDELPKILTDTQKGKDEDVQRKVGSFMTSFVCSHSRTQRSQQSGGYTKMDQNVMAPIVYIGATNAPRCGGAISDRMVDIVTRPSNRFGESASTAAIEGSGMNAAEQTKQASIIHSIRLLHGYTILTCKAIESGWLPKPDTTRLCLYIKTAQQFLDINYPHIISNKTRQPSTGFTIGFIWNIWRAVVAVFSHPPKEGQPNTWQSRLEEVIPYLIVSEEICMMVVSFIIHAAMNETGVAIARWITKIHGHFPFLSDIKRKAQDADRLSASKRHPHRLTHEQRQIYSRLSAFVFSFTDYQTSKSTDQPFNKTGNTRKSTHQKTAAFTQQAYFMQQTFMNQQLPNNSNNQDQDEMARVESDMKMKRQQRKEKANVEEQQAISGITTNVTSDTVPITKEQQACFIQQFFDTIEPPSQFEWSYKKEIIVDTHHQSFTYTSDDIIVPSPLSLPAKHTQPKKVAYNPNYITIHSPIESLIVNYITSNPKTLITADIGRAEFMRLCSIMVKCHAIPNIPESYGTQVMKDIERFRVELWNDKHAQLINYPLVIVEKTMVHILVQGIIATPHHIIQTTLNHLCNDTTTDQTIVICVPKNSNPNILKTVDLRRVPGKILRCINSIPETEAERQSIPKPSDTMVFCEESYTTEDSLYNIPHPPLSSQTWGHMSEYYNNANFIGSAGCADSLLVNLSLDSTQQAYVVAYAKEHDLKSYPEAIIDDIKLYDEDIDHEVVGFHSKRFHNNDDNQSKPKRRKVQH